MFYILMVVVAGGVALYWLYFFIRAFLRLIRSPVQRMSRTGLSLNYQVDKRYDLNSPFWARDDHHDSLW